jgi:hypothetical protein
MKHYVDWLQVFPNKTASSNAYCEDHNLPSILIVNGRTSGLTRTHTDYACSAQCLWDKVINSRWKGGK